MERWPHQIQGVQDVTTAIDAGERRLCLTSPTGGGKSVMIIDLLEWCAARGWPAVLYTNRKMLTEQLIGTLRNHGVPFGVRAAGFDELVNHDAPIQIASIQTEDARVWKSQKWLIHVAKLAIFDEAHLQKAGTAKRQMDLHMQHDCTLLGVTATPVALAGVYDRLIVAGVNSELRKCGALVPCHVVAPSELDTSKVKREKTGEYSLNDIRKSVWTQAIVGNVYDNWKRLNPHARPAILFAPGVDEAVGFVEYFESKGVKAASIDGEDCYFDGRAVASNREAREEVLGRFRSGEFKVLCNRFVLREGIDIPELYHGILATPFGSIQSYIQTVGRILRNHHTTPDVLLQDHGGNWWRHGSPNADRDWAGVWGLTDYQIVTRQIEKFQQKEEAEPICCPECGTVRRSGMECHKCGHRAAKKSRKVIQRSGELKDVTGDVFRERTVRCKPDTQRIWEACYYRMKRAGKTFRQAEGLFFYENHYWPPRSLPLMPANPLDWERKVKDVPTHNLIPKGELQ